MGGAANSEKKIVKPGYHIRPKYDLLGLRRRRTDDHKGHVAGELPLTALIDMYTVLVIYLLMNFSSTGDIFFLNKGLPLPKANKVTPMASSPLITIIGDEFTLDAPPEYEGLGTVDDGSPALEQISATLAMYKEAAKQKNIQAENRVNIQASEDTPIGHIKRAMTASVASGWTNINFVVAKPTSAP